MLRFTVLAIFLAAVSAVHLENKRSQTLEMQMAIVDNLEEYLLENPEVKVLNEFMENVNETLREITHKIGNRQPGE